MFESNYIIVIMCVLLYNYNIIYVNSKIPQKIFFMCKRFKNIFFIFFIKLD